MTTVFFPFQDPNLKNIGRWRITCNAGIAYSRSPGRPSFNRYCQIESYKKSAYFSYVFLDFCKNRLNTKNYDGQGVFWKATTPHFNCV